MTEQTRDLTLAVIQLLVALALAVLWWARWR